MFRRDATSGRQRGLWPIAVIVAIAAIVPSACVLWFATQAVRNERVAVQYRLDQIYRGQLRSSVAHLGERWGDHIASMSAAIGQGEPSGAEIFERLVGSGLADSVVVYDGAGVPEYPDAAQVVGDVHNQGWQGLARAECVEQGGSTMTDALAAYGHVIDEAEGVDVRACGLLGRARCLATSGRLAEALSLVLGPLSQPELATARNRQGRLVAPNGQLLAMHWVGDPGDPVYRRLRDALLNRLGDYGDPVMPSGQRRFLMAELTDMGVESPVLEMLGAESLADQLVEVGVFGSVVGELTYGPLRDVWLVGLGDGRIVAAFTAEGVAKRSRGWLATPALGTDADFELLGPGRAGSQAPDENIIRLAMTIPGWQIALVLPMTEPFELTAVASRESLYWWIGGGMAVFTAALAMFAGRMIARQARLTRLKNDLIATVSHELKTPLASMRVLVDTMLEGRYCDPEQARDYLQLLAKENVRLSRLIDNFLTFSRMERNRQVFDMRDVDVRPAIRQACEALGERLAAPGCRFEVDVADDLPMLVGDSDALATVMVNLLDNALKYTGTDKRIALRAWGDDGHMCIEVADNGVGLSRRASRRVFDRFYQVDRTLSRRAGGCGLGLSIVKFIVDAHGGTIEVVSQPDQGSQFTVRLPGRDRVASETQVGVASDGR